MRKGQAQIFSEFLSFAMGLVVTISIAYIFSGYFAPKLIDEAMNYHLENLLEQVRTAASQMIYYSEYFQGKTQTLKLNLPEKIAKQNYDVYKFNDKLCASVSGTEYFQCIDNNYTILGNYVSGTRMLLTLSTVDKQKIITISSD